MATEATPAPAGTPPSRLANQTKRRKVTAGGREEASAQFAISPSEDDSVIRHRLLTRVTTTRGEPPLKKLMKKFVGFATEVERETDNLADCERLYKAFLQELSTFELPLQKTRVTIDAKRREQESFRELQKDLCQQIAQTELDIEDLKVQLEESKIERQHKEECEAIRRLIAAQPPRLETQKVLDELLKELAQLEAENLAASKTLELRKKQFHLLLHLVHDLQSTIEDELKNSFEEIKTNTEDVKLSTAERESARVDINEPMQTEP